MSPTGRRKGLAVTENARLPEHVVFKELPFCGVLFDSRRTRVYRLTRRQAALLRQALNGRLPGGEAARLLDELSDLGLIRTGGDAG